MILNKWFIEKDGDSFIVAHYVSGEDGYIVEDRFNHVKEAQERADKLNEAYAVIEADSNL